ncbi:hypothetical protein [uncultured Paracoccus sp.]|uniref:hypothetical protein n=1 Tax=uncultured Paracoccus sp. TaxID=189685 RepID=UPI002639481E|nr:hypothetical protein [uncultured Paracoccus sp.]
MTINSVGDQSRALVLRSQTTRLRERLQDLTGEMSSGITADRAGRLSGNTVLLNHYESQIVQLTQYQQTGAEAGAIASATQDVLSALRADAATLRGSLLSVTPADSSGFIPLRAAEARGHFISAVGRLNTEVAGLHLFAGQNSDTPPLIEPEPILAELGLLTTGLTTADAVATVISDWFDAAPGAGGFLDFAYRGTIDQPRQIQISEDRSIAFTTTAATPVIRELLASLALAAVADSAALAASGAERLALIQRSSAALITNEAGLVDEMGRVGFLEALTERFGSENANALSVVQIGRAGLVTADPFETSTALHEVETQLETLYTLTARLSRLKLVDYLR